MLVLPHLWWINWIDLLSGSCAVGMAFEFEPPADAVFGALESKHLLLVFYMVKKKLDALHFEI